MKNDNTFASYLIGADSLLSECVGLLRQRGHTIRGVITDAPKHILNEALEFLLADNGWTDWVRELQISEIPGNHDSMVLEPNVRVLASRLRVCLDETDPKADELAVAVRR